MNSTPSPAMQVRFWGARGSIPTPTPANLRYGGNTSCVQVIASGDQTLIFDAGTGIHSLGQLLSMKAPQNIHIFLTHFHWDHIQGLPAFAPIFAPKTHITFYSSHSQDHLRNILRAQMTAPYFPVEFDALPSILDFVQIRSEGASIADIHISPITLNHPGSATGYRITRNGHTLVYATDHEHGNPFIDAGLRAASQSADLLIYDAQFTPETYQSHIGWGHSTWLEATRIANESAVKQLVLFHHDPLHDDQKMDQIASQAQQHFPNTTAATEALTLTLG